MPHKLLPAPGYTYEGIHGESNGIQMLIASWVTLGLAMIIYLLRMTVKIWIVRSTNWEDYLAAAALLPAIVRTAMLTISEHSNISYLSYH